MAESARRPIVRMPRDRRVQDIEAAAREVFSRHGFDAGSMAEIAAQAGVAEGTLYKYFANKRDLLIKVLEAWYQSMIRDFTEQLGAIHGTKSKIHYIVWRHLKSLKDNPELARLLYHEVRHSRAYYESSIHEFNRRYSRVLVDTCREGSRNGELRADLPVALLRDLIFGGIDHLISGSLFSRSDFDVDAAAEQIVHVFFEGIAMRPTQADSLGVALGRLEHVADRIETAAGYNKEPQPGRQDRRPGRYDGD